MKKHLRVRKDKPSLGKWGNDYFLKEREPFFFFSLYCPYNSPHSQHLTDSREKALQRNEVKVTYTV